MTTTDPNKDNEVKNDIGFQLVKRILEAKEYVIYLIDKITGHKKVLAQILK